MNSPVPSSAAHSAVREATEEDLPEILRLIHELAIYEREPDAVETTVAELQVAMFPTDGAPTAFVHVAELDGRVVGMALWFTTFSTWTGQPGIWLEDLFVDPEARGHGFGKALLSRLAAVCVERGWRRLEWTVLDWNDPSIQFYRAQGAVPMDEWTTHRVTGEALARLARG